MFGYFYSILYPILGSSGTITNVDKTTTDGLSKTTTSGIVKTRSI
jgi:hypothetical protein